MMQWATLFTGLALLSGLAPNDGVLVRSLRKSPVLSDEPATLRDWAGRWSGTVKVAGGADSPMALVIGAAKDGVIPWTIIYGEGERAQTRAYRVLIVDEKSGRYRLDEGGGVVIEARMIGAALHLVFEVAGATLHTSYEKSADGIRYRTLTTSRSAERLNLRGPAIHGHRHRGFQSAMLRGKRRRF